MSDYDSWMASEPDDPLFCPECMRPITDWRYEPDELVTIGVCECGWEGLDRQCLVTWEVEAEYKADRADMVNELRACGLI